MGGKLSFKTHIQLKNIIGKELINNDNIALLELVKNSFDASSNRVSIAFLNIKKNDDPSLREGEYTPQTSRIIVSDDGQGMSLQDIRDKWLNIAYSEKKDTPKKKGRRMSGAKGIGRFSCDRLGEYLNLYARIEDAENYVLLKIDWNLFEIDNDINREIQSVILDYEFLSDSDLEKRGIKSFNNGVVLEIIKLRKIWASLVENKKIKEKSWDLSKFIDLKKYLEKLINPNQAFEENDFGIYIEAAEFEEENNNSQPYNRFIGKVQNQIFEKLDFKSTSIESETRRNGTEIYTELKDRGETVFWVREKNIYAPFLQDVKISLNYLNPYAKAFFTRQTGVRPKDYGSVFLFINGFRVAPYGETADDWLRIDKRKTQRTGLRLGTRDIVGRVEILDDSNSPEFQIVTSREGIVRNESYEKLTEQHHNEGFFFKTLRRLERYVVEGLGWDNLTKEDLYRYSNIHNQIIAGDLTEEESLPFREEREVKTRRISDIIDNIIAVKEENLLEIYINEELVFEKIKTEIEETEKEIGKIVEQLHEKGVTSKSFEKILRKLSIKNDELRKQLGDFFSISGKSKRFKELREEFLSYQETVNSQSDQIKELSRKLVELQEQYSKVQQNLEESQSNASELEQQVENYQQEVAGLQENLSTAELKVKFYKKQVSKDTDALIHHIKNDSGSIIDAVDVLLEDLKGGKFSEKDEIIESLSFIKFHAEKCHKAASIITMVDLSESDTELIEIAAFLKGYTDNYQNIAGDKKVSLKYEHVGGDYQILSSKLELAIIVDNMIDNAVKWGANNVHIKSELVNKNQFFILISDNGKGLSKKYIDDPVRIFKFKESGIENGSGLGLYLVEEKLQSMGATIEYIDSGGVLNGATFRIVFMR